MSTDRDPETITQKELAIIALEEAIISLQHGAVADGLLCIKAALVRVKLIKEKEGS